jgi:Uma2 family endonuclease
MQSSMDKKLFTVAEVLQMDQAGLFRNQRVELIHGEILLMPKGSRHQARVDRITALFAQELGGRAIFRIQGPLLVDNYNLPEPDAMLMEPRADFYESGHPRPENILLLMEVADSSIQRDREVKLALYAISGIREYWIEDVLKDALLIFRDPAGDKYETCLTLRRGDTASPLSFPDIQFKVDQILG